MATRNITNAILFKDASAFLAMDTGILDEGIADLISRQESPDSRGHGIYRRYR